MADSGRGVGLTSSADRRVTRSASREAAAARTQPRTTQQQRTVQQPQSLTKQKAQSDEVEDEEDEDEEEEEEDEETDDGENFEADAEADENNDDDGSSPYSPDYERVKSSHLNEPRLSKAKRVYEYINRQHYQDIQNTQRAQQDELAAQQHEPQAAAQPRLYKLLLNDAANRSTLYTLLAVSAVMVVAPLVTFYGVSAVLSAMGWADKWRLSVSGGCAVVVVNVVSVGFGLYAYWEKEDEESEEEREAREARSRAVQDDWVRQVTKGQMVGVGKWNEELKQERDEAKQGRRKVR